MPAVGDKTSKANTFLSSFIPDTGHGVSYESSGDLGTSNEKEDPNLQNGIHFETAIVCQLLTIMMLQL